MSPSSAFRELVAEPLEAVIGKVLLRVNYWILTSDLLDFDVNVPNETGICTITLHFESAIIEIFPGWNDELRPENAYYIQTGVVSEGSLSEQISRSEYLAVISVSESVLWRAALSQPLMAVEVFAFDTSPQLIGFTFGSAKIIVSVGYPGDHPSEDPILVGDGDNILVFPYEQWPHLRKTLPIEWTKLWECCASQ